MFWFGGALLVLSLCVAQTTDGAVSEPERDDRGILVHTVRCPYQDGQTQIRVLLPEPLPLGRRYPVVYVLPVEPQRQHRFGDGLEEIQHLGLQRQYGAIFVSPTFSHLPWYADHPTRLEIRQEAYLLQVVVRMVEKRYPSQGEASGRLLLGFSKSGWGAFSLLLRHPTMFGKAVAWDAPLMMERPDRYGMGEIFGTQENFDRYRIDRLLGERAAELHGRERLIVLGYGNFREQCQKADRLLAKLGIAHQYRDGPAREHTWQSGWVAEAVEMLLGGPEGDEAAK